MVIFAVCCASIQVYIGALRIALNPQDQRSSERLSNVHELRRIADRYLPLCSRLNVRTPKNRAKHLSGFDATETEVQV